MFLGSLIFPYATTLFAHAGTVALSTVALWAVLDDGPTARRRAYAGGICAGLAFASEYPAIIPVARPVLLPGVWWIAIARADSRSP